MYIDIKEQKGQYWLENIMKDKFAVSMFGQKRLSREGGIEIVVKELCTRMARDGCQVTCYNRSGHHEMCIRDSLWNDQSRLPQPVPSL